MKKNRLRKGARKLFDGGDKKRKKYFMYISLLYLEVFAVVVVFVVVVFIVHVFVSVVFVVFIVHMTTQECDFIHRIKLNVAIMQP